MLADAPLVGGTYLTPWGPLGVITTPDGAVVRSGLSPLPALAASLADRGRRAEVVVGPQPQVHAAIDAWLDHDGDALMEIAVDLAGAPFAVEVWHAARSVPYGETVSYGELAAMAGKPRAARAVGTACATCPATPFVPCHRVIAAGGRLGGYGPGGDALKRALLAHEGVVVRA